MVGIYTLIYRNSTELRGEYFLYEFRLSKCCSRLMWEGVYNLATSQESGTKRQRKVTKEIELDEVDIRMERLDIFAFGIYSY